MRERSFLVTLITLVHFVDVQSKCSNEAYGLYCTDLTTEDDSNDFLIFKTNDSLPNNSMKAIFLKNSTGNISIESFSLFPQTKSLDVQYCEIEEFSTDELDLQNLYLMNNNKLPELTAEVFGRCCGNLMTLYVYDNENLIIEDGCFTSLTHLNHLTINKQDIQNLTKLFLSGLTEITYLNLNENGIELVEEDAFTDMPNLSYLILNDNKITEFEDDTFIPLKGLQSLEILRLQIDNLNISIFESLKEIKNIGLPTKIIKEQIQLSNLTTTFRKLETIVLSESDKNDEDVNTFILSCEDAGFPVKFG